MGFTKPDPNEKAFRYGMPFKKYSKRII